MPQHALPESVLPVRSILPALAYVFQLRAQADEQRHQARVEVGADGLLVQEWRGLKVPGHVDEVLKAVKTLKALKQAA